MQHVYDMVIIGGGPAGYTAALYASRAGLDIVLTERLSAGGQMALTGEIDNYPGFDEGIDGFTLGEKMRKSAERFGAVTKYAKVQSVDFSDKIKKAETSSEIFLGKTIIIATGADPRKLGLANEQALTGNGVHYCAHCDGRFYKDKTVVVIGGGNSAAADALYLSRLAKKVFVVHRRDSLRADRISYEHLIKAQNVEFIWNSTVSEIIAAGNVTGAMLTDARTKAVTEIKCDGIFVSIGRTPATGFLNSAVTLDKAGYIIADENTKTNIDGVFAAGDVRTKALRQIVTAVADGAAAAHFAEEYLSDNE